MLDAASGIQAAPYVASRPAPVLSAPARRTPLAAAGSLLAHLVLAGALLAAVRLRDPLPVMADQAVEMVFDAAPASLPIPAAEDPVPPTEAADLSAPATPHSEPPLAQALSPPAAPSPEPLPAPEPLPMPTPDAAPPDPEPLLPPRAEPAPPQPLLAPEPLPAPPPPAPVPAKQDLTAPQPPQPPALPLRPVPRPTPPRPLARPAAPRGPIEAPPSAAPVTAAAPPARTPASPPIFLPAAPAQPPAPSVEVSPAWRGALAAWVQSHRTYPAAARAAGQEGRVGIRFTVDRTGHVLSAQVVSSSGSSMLDDGARSLLASAQLPPFPPSMVQPQQTVVLGIQYNLER